MEHLSRYTNSEDLLERANRVFPKDSSGNSKPEEELHKRVDYDVVDPKLVLRKTGRLDLGAKGALQSGVKGRSIVEVR